MDWLPPFWVMVLYLMFVLIWYTLLRVVIFRDVYIAVRKSEKKVNRDLVTFTTFERDEARSSRRQEIAFIIAVITASPGTIWLANAFLSVFGS